MVGTIRQKQQDGVAIIALSHPPWNRLSAQMRRDLDQALTQAMGDPAVTAILLHGLAGPGEAATRGLSSGLDPEEAETGFTAPLMADLCCRIAASDTPVVVLLHGVTLGAGVELALAAHARLATETAQIGFPEVQMALLPSAGATQRLPRFLGAQGALDLLLTPSPRPLAAPELRPLRDWLLAQKDDPEAAGVVLARALAGELDAARALAGQLNTTRALAGQLNTARALAGDPVAGGGLPRSDDRHDGLADVAANARAIAARRAQVAANPTGAGARIVTDVVNCIEAACLLPVNAGLAFEEVTHQDLLDTDLSRGLRHAHLAEARTADIPELAELNRPGQTPPPVQKVALVGSAASAHLAAACLEAGLPVVQYAHNAAALAALRAGVAAAQAALVRAGRLTPATAEAQMARWHGTARLADLSGADLLIEAVADTLDSKQQVMAALDRLAPQGAVLVTTSALHPIARIAAATSRPAAVLGLHLADPAHLSRLAEVIPGPATAPQALARTVALLRDRMGRIPVRSGTGGGSMAEVILSALRQAGAGMLRSGTGPAAIDSALQGYGLTHGLFRQMDMTGLDHCLAQARVATATLDNGQTFLGDLDRLILSGRTGQAAGRGFYLWQDGQPQPDPAVMALLDLHSVTAPGLGAAQAGPLSPEAIVLRAVAAMANAGARALRAGLALRPSDIDVVMIQGHGFPRWHGGPMKAADLVGLFDILQALKRFSADDPALYAPDPIFASLVREGRQFAGLNLLKSP